MAAAVFLAAALGLAGGSQDTAASLPDHFMGFKLSEPFDPSLLKLSAELCHEQPTGVAGTTGVVVHLQKQNGDSFEYEGAGDELPYPLKTERGVKYRTRADITLLPDRRIYQIFVIIRVSSEKNSRAAIEKSLMAAYGKFFSEKKGPYGTYQELVFRDDDKEMKVGYADGGVELSVGLMRLR